MMRGSLTSAGLFAGIGGIELGLERVGFSASLLCELDSAAQVVFRRSMCLPPDFLVRISAKLVGQRASVVPSPD
jgi:hypothetical protein